MGVYSIDRVGGKLKSVCKAKFRNWLVLQSNSIRWDTQLKLVFDFEILYLIDTQ